MSQDEHPEKQPKDQPKSNKPSRKKPDPATLKEFEQQILTAVSAKGYRPVKPKVLAKKLKIDKDLQTDFRRVVKKLVKAHKLSWGSEHLVTRSKSEAAAKEVAKEVARAAKRKSYAKQEQADDDLPSPKNRDQKKSNKDSAKKPKKDSLKGAVVGRFRRAKQGFGFVVPDREKHPDIEGDIHVPFRYTQDAANDDTVAVKLITQSEKRAEKGLLGRIIDVISRNKYKFVGTYREEEGRGIVTVANTSAWQARFLAE